MIQEMAKEKTAIIMLPKAWANTAAVLINEGRPSQSTGDVHMFIAPFLETDDKGVWLKEIVSHQLTEDRSAVTMTVMIPWSAILALAIVDEVHGKLPLGFTAPDQTPTP
jgi:hypothetical protein